MAIQTMTKTSHEEETTFKVVGGEESVAAVGEEQSLPSDSCQQKNKNNRRRDRNNSAGPLKIRFSLFNKSKGKARQVLSVNGMGEEGHGHQEDTDDDGFKLITERSLSLTSDTSRCSSIVSTTSSSEETPCPVSPTSPTASTSSSDPDSPPNPSSLPNQTRRRCPIMSPSSSPSTSSSAASALTATSAASSSSSSSRIRARYLRKLGVGLSRKNLIPRRSADHQEEPPSASIGRGERRPTQNAATAAGTTVSPQRCQKQEQRSPTRRVRFSTNSDVNNNKYNVEPRLKLSVRTIPSLDQYTEDEKRTMWHLGDYDQMVRRNIIEFQSEGWDWTNCLEEDQFVRIQVDNKCSSSNGSSDGCMLVHPVHVWIQQQQQQNLSFSPPVSPTQNTNNRAQRQLIRVLRAQQQHQHQYQQQQEEGQVFGGLTGWV
mmetsp:Transcript_10384/g.24932  ORF Transcript_10384/g.24932 Transcript_10384/m.24932 type:complete len:429 (-) Transcript_10384:57-1343(-)